MNGNEISAIQTWLNETYGAGLAVDNDYGPLTVNAVVRGVQTELNAQLGANITVDGEFGPASQAAWDTVKFGAQGNFTRLIQAQLIGLGYDVSGFDGGFGQGLFTAVQTFQSDYGLQVDGQVGPATAYGLFTALEGEENPAPTILHEIQQWLNQTYSTGLTVDGAYGPATSEAIVVGVQTELNLQLGANIEVDGEFGPASQAAWDTVKFGAQGNFTHLIQAQLIGLGYDAGGFDGEFGQGLFTAVQTYQSDHGLEVDGQVGPATAYSLFNGGTSNGGGNDGDNGDGGDDNGGGGDVGNEGDLPGSLQEAEPNMLGFDTSSIVSSSIAQQMLDSGYEYAIRYVSLNPTDEDNLTISEAIGILESGLGLMIVQRVLNPGWTPTPSLGTEYGINAANNVANLGFPEGITVFLDLEGIDLSTPSSDIIAYCTNWYNEVENKGFSPGIYVAYDSGLDSSQLSNLPFKYYWKAGSDVPVPDTGWDLIQQLPLDIIVNGLQIDEDMTQSTDTPVRWLRL